MNNSYKTDKSNTSPLSLKLKLNGLNNNINNNNTTNLSSQ